MESTDNEYSDYIVYVDESGDHSLTSIDQSYPVFVLTLCIFEKKYYSEVIVPAFRKLKFEMFGHDMVVLHEHDIRKKRGAFSAFGKEKRELFFDKINMMISQTEFILISRVIDKVEINKQKTKDLHIYHLSMKLALEELYSFLQEKGQPNRLVHIVCEARGAAEDKALEIEFSRICKGDNIYGERLPFQIIIAHKQTNSEGLQLADLTARPVGLSIIYPNQSNRAMKILERKIYRYQELNNAKRGNLVYPSKSEKPQGTP